MERLASWIEKRYSHLLGFVLLAALIVRLPLLDGSFWLDEAAQALESTRPWWQQLSIAQDFQPPFYHLIVHLLQYVSHAEWWLRLASLLPGLGSIALIMEIVRARWGKEAALASGLALAFSSFHVFFSQELRPYMLAVFWCSLAWLAFERWMWKPQGKSGVWQGLFIFSLTASWYTSYVALFWAPTFLVLTLFFRQKRLKSVFVAMVVSGVLFLPWLGGLKDQLAVGGALRGSLPGWEAVVSLPAVKAFPLTLAKFLIGQQEIDLGWKDGILIVVPYGIWLFGAFTATRRSFKAREREGLFSLVLLFIFPLLLTWLFSFVTPVLAPKRVMFVLPVWTALLGWLVSQRRRWGWLVTGVFLLYQVAGLVSYWSNPLLQRENWREIVLQIEARFPVEQTGIVMAFDAPFAPWQWYSQVPYPVVTTGISPLQESMHTTEKLRPVLARQNVLVFDYLRDLTDPYRLIDSALQGAGYREIGAIDGSQVGFIRVFTQNRLYAGRKL